MTEQERIALALSIARTERGSLWAAIASQLDWPNETWTELGVSAAMNNFAIAAYNQGKRDAV